MTVTLLASLACADAALAFCDRHPGADAAVEKTLERLREVLLHAHRLRALQWAAMEEMERAGRERDALARAFRERVDPLVRLAHAVAQAHGIPELRLRRPGKVESPGNFLPAVRRLLRAAHHHRRLLLEAGMPRHMLTALGRECSALHAAQDRRRAAAESQVAMGAERKRTCREAMRLVRHLDALFRIRFLAAPELLAEWHAVLGRGREGSERSVA